MNKQIRFNGLVTLMSSLVRQDVYEGATYNVCPVILMTEGVHNGTYYSREELSKFPDAWNGRPLPVYHPMENGKPVTANSPETLSESVGYLFNVHWEVDEDQDIGKLKGEAWIGTEKALAVAPRVMEKLNNSEMMEVSTGVFTENILTEGEFGGETFKAIATNLRPDHLALLPDGIGACSIDDGGGLPRLNHAQTEEDKLEILKKLGPELLKKFARNELSFSAIRTALGGIIRAKLSLPEKDWVFVRDVYQSFFIYEIEVGAQDGPGVMTLYKQAYGLDADEKVVLNGDPIAVREAVSYVPVITTNQSPEGGTTQGESVMDRKTQVNELIANDKCAWAEGHRSFLEGLADDEFAVVQEEALKTNDVEPAAAPVAAPAAADKGAEPTAPAAAPAGEAPVVNSAESFIDNAPEGIKGMLQSGLSTYRAQHTALVAALVANENCAFTEAALKAKDVAELQSLAKLAGSGTAADDDAEVDFSALNVNDLSANSDDQPEAMPRMDFAPHGG
jgi:hypothetical protein